MKKVLFILKLLLITINLFSQNLTGTVLDEEQNPIAFVNVTLHEIPDSVPIKGCITNEEGGFLIKNASLLNTFLKVSCIGYETQTILTKTQQKIILKKKSIELDEVVISGTRKIYKSQNGTIKASVKNTILETLPTANDIIEQLPFVYNNEGNYSVLGKGKPAIYINNKLVRDEKEINQLLPKDIKDIEIITSPGAQYDATVKSVIRINLTKEVGDGLSGVLYTKEGSSNVFFGNEYISLNYRKKSLDVFGSINYTHSKYSSSFLSNQYILDTIRSEQITKENEEGNTFVTNPMVGINFNPSKNISTGLKYKYLNKKYSDIADNRIENNNPDGSELISQNTDLTEKSSKHQFNAYYNGILSKKLSISLNSDYLNGKDNIQQNSLIQETNDIINNENIRNYSLFAVKGMLSYSFNTGILSLGSEYSYTNVKQKYNINDQELGIANTNDKLVQNRTALFTTYHFPIGKYKFNIGFRTENIQFNYYENNNLNSNQSKNYIEFFPNISLSYSDDKIHYILAYERKINYPTYTQLRSNIQYSSPFVYESGNPNLLPEISNSFSGMFAWKDIHLMVGYNDNKNDIQNIFLQYEDQFIFLIKDENIPNSKDVNIGVSYMPAIKLWKPRFEIAGMKQWLELNNINQNFSEPLLMAKWNNIFVFPQNWIFYFNTNYRSSGHNGVIFVEPSWGINLKLSKQLLNKKLKIIFAANDILKTNKVKWTMKYDNLGMLYDKSINSRLFYIAITYRFNSTKNKYKGQQASDEINRL